MVLPLIDGMDLVMLCNVKRTRGENSAPNLQLISYSEAEENNKMNLSKNKDKIDK